MDDERLKQHHNYKSLQTSPEYICYRALCTDKQLENTHRDHAKFRISSLVHYTSANNYMNILQEGKIRPGQTRQLGALGSFQLSWWSLSFSPETDEDCLAYVGAMSQNGSPRPSEYRKLLKSEPFSHFSRFGNYGISVPIQSLLRSYEESVEAKCELRVLWTYVYPWEIHAYRFGASG